MRKSKLQECGSKNCDIKGKDRNCSMCRYKKCIAVGMSMSRSQYGRHTQRSIVYPSNNMSVYLSSQIDLIKSQLRFKSQLFVNAGQFALSGQDIYHLNDLIIEFYDRSLNLLQRTGANESEAFKKTLTKSSSNVTANITSPSSSLSSISSSSLNSIAELSTLIASSQSSGMVSLF